MLTKNDDDVNAQFQTNIEFYFTICPVLFSNTFNIYFCDFPINRLDDTYQTFIKIFYFESGIMNTEPCLTDV